MFFKPQQHLETSAINSIKLIQINYLSIMLVYIFFNKKTCQLFEKPATSSGIKAIISCEDACFTVRLPKDSDEVVLEKLEDYYDELMDLDRALAEQERDDLSEIIHAAGITIRARI